MLYKRTKISKCLLVGTILSTPLYAAELSLPQFPLQITEYVEPNVMLLLDTSGSMGNLENGESRISIIKDIATNLIETNKNIRFCLARFRYDQGGKILSECGSSNEAINNMKTAIAGLTAGGSTPLAESYYEVISYFAGKAPKYINGAGDHANNDNNIAVTRINGKYISPIEYRCQKNYTIVMTDGTAQLDSYFPDFPADKEHLYGVAPNTDYNIHPNYSSAIASDGDYDAKNNDGNGGTVVGSGSNSGNLGVYEFLDDMAKYAWDVDLRRSGVDNAQNDQTGKSFDDPSNNSEFSQQNLNTYTVGFTLDIDMLRDAADYGKGGTGNGDFDGDGDVDADDAANDNYFTAANRAELTQAFQDAIDQISAENQSSAEPTISSDLYSAELRLFQTRFTNTKWTGELLAYQIVSNSSGTYDLVQDWAAPANFPSSWQNRVIDTGINGGVPLKWGQLDTAQKTAWFAGQRQRLNYIRGKTAEQIGLDNYRDRESLMGDIVNSSPLYVGPPESDEHMFSASDTSLKASYLSFVGVQSTVAAMIYVGANDGMLHGFDISGQEKMAFVPSKVMPNLAELSQADYGHLFYVDGAPSSANVYAEFVPGSKSWKTVLVGGLRRGGQGIYALDVTDPTRFVNGDNSADNTRASQTFLWEFSDDETLGSVSSTDKYTADQDLGYSYSAPQIMRLNDGEFYVVLGSGYNNTEADGHASTTGDAVLFLLNVATGAVVKKITTGYGMSQDPKSASLGNGLATVKGFDAGQLEDGKIQGEADGKIDYIYAGDLFGNLWKFDLSSADPQDWGYVAEKNSDDSLNANRNPIKLFTAKIDPQNYQPITVQLAVHKLYSSEIMLYFGTGKLLEHLDTQTDNVAPQSFYAIADRSYTGYESGYGETDTSPKIAGRSELLEQRITHQEYVNFSGISKEVRGVTEFTRTTQKGWYIDLQKPVTNTSGDTSYQQEGEQVVVRARVLDNYVYFVTNFADQDACLPPVKKNFLMIFSVKSGASISLNNTVIDTNEDGTIDQYDNATFADGSTKAVTGRTGFGTQLPVIIKTNQSTGEGMICDALNCYKMKSPGMEWNRTSWKEIKTD
ncbi:MAG: hypothetical protein HRU05_04360 [Oceanospirillaceae bacterium]|nr:hypothetical protein [Oceanospirillaceae bacterium]